MHKCKCSSCLSVVIVYVCSPSVSICGLQLSPVDYLCHAYSLHSVRITFSKTADICDSLCENPKSFSFFFLLFSA